MTRFEHELTKILTQEIEKSRDILEVVTTDVTFHRGRINAFRQVLSEFIDEANKKVNEDR